MSISLPRVAAALALAGGIAGFTAPAAACGSEPYIGEICTFAFAFCPQGYIPADGRLLPVNQNQALFSLLGPTYGGDGRTTFAVPDLRGRIPVNAGTPPFPDVPKLTVGQKAGSSSVTLTADNLPQHTHAATFVPTYDTAPYTLSNNGPADPKTQTVVAKVDTAKPGAPTPPPPAPAPVVGGTVTVSPNPSPNTPVSTQSPVIGMTVCVAAQGLYPPRE